MKEPCVYMLASRRDGVLYIRREAQLKKWKRAWKVRLIENMNPEWLNLFDPATGEILFGPADLARIAQR
jgi:putative endonuclease